MDFNTELKLIIYDPSGESMMNTERFKQLTLRSIVTVFGVLEASRIKFEISKRSQVTQSSKPLEYIALQTDTKYENTLRTAISLNKENLRVKFI